MSAIKFSHYYPKLHHQTSAELLAVRPIKIDANTPQELLDYDTVNDSGDRYPLKHGDYIQLIFLGNLRIPFCTIRSAYPPSKVDYYRGSIGRTFNIETPAEPVCENCENFVAEVGKCWVCDHPHVNCAFFHRRENRLSPTK